MQVFLHHACDNGLAGTARPAQVRGVCKIRMEQFLIAHPDFSDENQDSIVLFPLKLFSMQVSRSVAFKRLLGRAAVGTSLLVACLQAGAASALSFNFSFTGTGFPDSPATVTGIVDGLVDNTNDQTTGVTVTITSATNGPSGTVFTDANYVSGSGFDVASGQLTSVNIFYALGLLELYLGNENDFIPEYRRFDGVNSFDNFDPSIVFTPVTSGPASVPGPLPVFGAGAAFGWSRKLRRKIKATA